MKKQTHQTVIQKIRDLTPLRIRQKIGPVLAHIYYIDRLYLRPHNKKPHILSIDETIDKVLREKLSVIRFGDGEISLIDGTDLGFQKKNDELARKLEEIIKAKHENLMLCIPGMWGSLDVFAPYARKFIMHYMYRYNHIWSSLLSYTQVYGDTNFTRHYLAYKDKGDAKERFKKIFSMWEGGNVVLVEGSKSRLGVGNDMFKNVSTMKRILCPPENAYAKYSEILGEASKQSKDTLILLSLGPTAKILAYNLFLLGYRVLDIGHIDMEYEMFLRKEDHQVKVPHKYFNEINERDPEDCLDEEYLKQVIVEIK